jgi:ubiquinone/menaquinone biosynthesis C-methylase UbiE
MNDSRRLSQERFSRYANSYVTSPIHAQGDDLAHMVAWAQPQPNWRMLDVATGGGHTALTFAPHVGQVIALDLSEPMLHAARAHHAQNGAHTIGYAAGEGERIPFAPRSFDLVTCRIAAHHFPNVDYFINDVARVLKVGGSLLLQDYVLPEEARAARYIDSYNRLRDPSHNRAFADYEWRGMCLNAGLQPVQDEVIRKRERVTAWVARQECPPAVTERLQVMLVQAPHAVVDWLRPSGAGTIEAQFDLVYMLLHARKEG